MKKLINILAIATVFGAALTGCDKFAEENGATGKNEIKFSASVGSFQVKATDTAFEDGDMIGLFADDPVYVENVKLTFSNGNLTPEEPVFWGDQQLLEQPTYFYAYYPYSAELLDEGMQGDQRHFHFSVNADQSTHAALTASDLMMAKAQSSPADGTVQLNFAHALSKIVFTVENRIDEVAVKSILLGNVCTGGWANIGEIGSAWTDWDEPVTVVPEAFQLNGEAAWAAIVPPQYARPAILVEMADGRQFTFNTEQEVCFEPSRRYNAKVVIDATCISTDFTASVSDWIDNDDITFGQWKDYGDWILVVNNDYSYWMERYTNAERTTYIEAHQGDNVMFYSQEGSVMGISATTSTIESGVLYDLVAGGAALVIPEDGVWFVNINLANNYVYAIRTGDLPVYEDPVWSLIGTINGTNWDYDFDMTMDESGVYYAEFEYHEGEEFKFRRDHDWSVNFGVAYGTEALQADNAYEVYQDGQNIMLSQSGVWRVRLETQYNMITMWRIGDIEEPGIELDQIQPIVECQDGTEGEFTQVVYAVSTNGFVVYDGKYSIFCYTRTDPQVYPGYVVHVSGTKTTYNGVPEVTDVTFEVLAQEYEDMIDLSYMYNDVSGYLDQGFADIAIPISIEGALGSDARTISVEGQTMQGSIYYAPDYWGLQELANHNVIASGFYNGRSESRVYIIITNIADLGEIEVEEPEEPEVPEGTTFIAFEKATLAGFAASGAIVELDEVISMSNSSNYGTTTVTELRVYKNQTLTLAAAEGFEIVLVEFACQANGTTKYGPGCFAEVEGYTYESNSSNGLWTGNATELVFTASTNQVRIEGLKVGYVAVQ